MGIYVGVNGLNKKVTKIYVGVNGVNKQVQKVYVGVDGKEKLCYTWEVIPAVPASIVVASTAANSITLRITKAVLETDSLPAGYRIYRAASSGGTKVLIAETPYTGAASYSYADTGLATGTTYYYWATAYNSAGESAFTAYVSGSATVIPAVPASIAVTASDSGRLTLRVTKASAETASLPTGYRIYRSTSSGGAKTLVATITPTGAAN
jgi:fibronectin type 3 domain-containing protein